MEIRFQVVVGKSEKPHDITVGEKYQAYAGEYVVREISAKEGIIIIDNLIRGNKEFEENPDKISSEQIRKSQIEYATIFNGKPLVIGNLDQIPNKLWQMLIAANEVLNSISDSEARFLLSPSNSKTKQSIQR